MDASLRLWVLGAVLLGINAAVGATASAGPDPGPDAIRIEMTDGLLNLETRDAPLHEVMRAIGELGGFKTILVEDFIDPLLVNVSFQNVSVREAVERLVDDKNRIILYATAGDEAERRVISQVWLLGSSDVPGGVEARVDDTIALAPDVRHDEAGIHSEDDSPAPQRPPLSKKDVKQHALGRLTKTLRQDQQAFTRARAAIALGVLGDEAAVPALETALLDEDSSVRSRAIGALGRIGGERATMVLGNILLHGSQDQTERVMAAQALWRLDSEAARGYLRVGARDVDEQVRLASNQPSSSPKAGFMDVQGGSDQAE